MIGANGEAKVAKRTKEEVAEQLAQAHYDVDAGVQEIIRLLAADEREAEEGEPIKLLEVNADASPSGQEQVRPVYFGTHPASGMIYPSAIVEVTPEEFNDGRLVTDLLQRYGWRRGPLLRTRSPRSS